MSESHMDKAIRLATEISSDVAELHAAFGEALAFLKSCEFEHDLDSRCHQCGGQMIHRDNCRLAELLNKWSKK